MQYLVLVTLILLVVALARSKVRPFYLFGGALAFFYVVELIPTAQLLRNYVNEGLATLVLLLLISSVLENTVFVRRNSDLFFAQGGYHSLLFKATLATSFFSALLNNTAVVALLMGAVRRQQQVLPSRLLLPISYAAILGGTVTLIGTSTNLIINSFVIGAGMPPLGMFDFAPIGIALVVCGLLYMLLFSSRLLPQTAPDQSRDKRRYFIEARVGKQSPLIGNSVFENGFRNMRELFLAEIVRGERLISPVSPAEVVGAGDVLVFTGNVEEIGELRSFDGLEIFEEHSGILDSNLVEVVVSHRSDLIGRRIKEAGFRAKFNAAVVAVRRGSHSLRGKIGMIRIEAGDQMILSIGPDFKERCNIENNFYLISTVSKSSLLSRRDSIFAIALFAAAVAVSALGLISLFKAMLLVMVLFMMMRWTDLGQLKLQLPLELIIIVGSALGIAEVMISSGAAMLLVDLITSLFHGMGPHGYLVAVYLLTLMLTEIITNNAAAALMFPIAYAGAQSQGMEAMPFIMAVAYGASASFITPYGYQTNLMVYSAGRYRFSDYAKYGMPLSMLYSAIVLAMLPVVFPLEPGG